MKIKALQKIIRHTLSKRHMRNITVEESYRSCKDFDINLPYTRPMHLEDT